MGQAPSPTSAGLGCRVGGLDETGAAGCAATCEPIAGGGAHVGERREVLGQRRPARSTSPRSRACRSAPPRQCAARLRRRRHAAEGDPRVGDPARRRGEREGRRSTAEMSWSKRLADLVGAEARGRPRACGTMTPRRTRPAAGPACRRRGRSPRAAARGARLPRRSTSVAPERDQRGRACRRSASRWRCCRRSCRRCGPAAEPKRRRSRRCRDRARPAPRMRSV